MRTLKVCSSALVVALLLTLLPMALPVFAESAWEGAQPVSSNGDSNSIPEVDRDGSTAVVVWVHNDGNADIYRSYSTDGGASFSKPQPLVSCPQLTPATVSLGDKNSYVSSSTPRIIAILTAHRAASSIPASSTAVVLNWRFHI